MRPGWSRAIRRGWPCVVPPHAPLWPAAPAGRKRQRSMELIEAQGCRGRGFTLVELMVVIVIAGLLLGMSIPPFLKYSRSLRERGAREQIVQDLRTARQTAVTRHSQVIVAFPTSTNAQSYTVLDDSNGNRAKEPSERQDTRSLPKDTYLEALELTPADSV